MFNMGVDSAKGKWLTIGLSESEIYEVRLFNTIGEIWDRYNGAELILIDIPIGIRESGSEGRICDIMAHRLLGPRRSSVFRVPCRATLEATNYDDAKIINKAKTGKSLAIQSWSIIPKIRELDEFLNKNISSRSKIREIHPEVCFYALNGGKPMEFNKKKAEGFQERIKVLRRVCDYTDKVIQLAKSELYGKVADDDILDALVAAVTAHLGNGRFMTLPERPETDARGLPMEMVYYPRS